MVADPHAGETPEQRDARELAELKRRLGTRDGQADEYRQAVKQALQAMNFEVAANGAQPRIDSVLQALTMLQAEFVAMYPARSDRRRLQAEIAANLGRLTSLHVDMGQKAAKVLQNDQSDDDPLDDVAGHG